MMHKIAVIKAQAPKDSDYEYITDAAVQNTLKEYWDWAEEVGAELQFSISYPEAAWVYGHMMHVNAEFNNEQDYKDFVVQFMWQLPKTHLNLAGEHWKYEFV